MPQFAFHEGFVNDYSGSDIRKFILLPSLDLFSQRLEASLHPVHADRDAIDQRK